MAALSPLARGRLITLAGVLLLCWDTPTYRKLRLRMPASHPRFGFAVSVWRGLSTAVACTFGVAWLDGWSVAASREHVRVLGPWKLLLATVLMAFSSLFFTVAVALTSAANVLVIVALGPLITALMCRAALGAKLPTHSWVACVCGFLSVAVVFLGSMEAGSAVGCLVAAGCPLCFGAYLTLATHCGDVSLSPCMPLSGVLVLLVALAALGKDATGAAPLSASQLALAMFNGTSNALSNLLLTVGSQTTPGPEVALIALLETALSPFLVYALVGERPSGQTVAAGVLIVLTLCAHAAYDMHLSRKASGGADIEAAEQANEEGMELLAAAPAEADGEEKCAAVS